MSEDPVLRALFERAKTIMEELRQKAAQAEVLFAEACRLVGEKPTNARSPAPAHPLHERSFH